MSELYPGAVMVATALGLHGYRKGSLSLSGALTAGLVGYGHLANPLKVFGITLIAFYLTASRATKVKIHRKAELEDGVDPLKPSGNRKGFQVLSNSLPSLVAALAYRFSAATELNANNVIIPLDPFGRPLIYAALGLFSNCLADTLASELGILSSSPPRFILTGREVPPGTNGGVSPLGLGVSAAGGLLMGATMAGVLMIENPAARRSVGWVGEMIALGTVVGLGGSLVSCPAMFDLGE